MPCSARNQAGLLVRVASSALAIACLGFTASPPAVAEPAPREEATPEPISEAEAADAAQAQLNQGFAKLLTGATLSGSFTVDRDRGDGEPAKPPREEEYTISSAIHLGGELWLITSRIRYGDVDATVPVPVAVKWAGNTPVITLDEVTLPGMGTFSSRVLFHGNRYAGTWQHDDVGGLMFGRVQSKEDGDTQKAE
jgi:hypothetical protein